MHVQPPLFEVFGIEFTSVMATTFVLTWGIALVAIFASKRLKTVPGPLQNLLEWILEKLENFFTDLMGREMARTYLPFIGSLFVYILLANYSGLLPMAGHLPGLAAPTSSLGVTAGLAICVFFATHIYGIKSHGLLGYGKSFFSPVAFIMPLLLIEEFVRPVSLSLRLYGNIFGEEAVASQFFSMIPLLVPLPMYFLSLLLGFVQALVFSTLAAVYISSAAGAAH